VNYFRDGPTLTHLELKAHNNPNNNNNPSQTADETPTQ